MPVKQRMQFTELSPLESQSTLNDWLLDSTPKLGLLLYHCIQTSAAGEQITKRSVLNRNYITPDVALEGGGAKAIYRLGGPIEVAVHSSRVRALEGDARIPVSNLENCQCCVPIFHQLQCWCFWNSQCQCGNLSKFPISKCWNLEPSVGCRFSQKARLACRQSPLPEP